VGDSGATLRHAARLPDDQLGQDGHGQPSGKAGDPREAGPQPIRMPAALAAGVRTPSLA